MFREGLLVVASGPSGTGKGTLLQLLREVNDKLRFSVSATTRKPREGEVEGKNYFFKEVDEFKGMVENDELIEWTQYCGNYYGTPRRYVEECIGSGYDVMLEIEVEGAINIKKKYPESVSIFILPPSFDELRKRIEGRGTEAKEVIEKRLCRAKEEMKLVEMYDYIIINDKLDEAVAHINSILISEKLRYARNKNILEDIGM
ncbi:MAG: guanylate kinase [Clostridia bacterium]|nr:guanylate kinase [Clostridia bacterium]